MSQKDERTIRYIIQSNKEGRDATVERRKVWKELWTAYQNKGDYSKKKDWQSKCFIPKVFMIIEQSSAMVKRAIISTRELFELSPKYKDDELAKRFQEKAGDALKIRLEESNFANAYGEMTKSCFLLGLGIPKVLWNDGFVFSNTNAFNISVDPRYEPHQKNPPKYIIEEGTMDLAELRLMAKRINTESGRPLYRMNEINRITGDFELIEKEWELRQTTGISQYTKIDKRVKLLQYWGDVISENDKTIEKNQLIVLANDKYIIRWQDNPFDHKRPPYVLTSPLVYPHRGVAGTGLAESIISMLYTYNNVVNMMVDNLNFSVNKVFEYQPTNIINPINLTSVYPGKLIQKHTPNAALTEVRTSSVGNDVFESLKLFNDEIQKGSAVTEFTAGWAGTRKTLGEVEIKTAQAQGLFDIIARDIEANSLAPLIEMCFDLMIQFGEIPSELRGRYRFNVGGLSLLLAQREQKQNMGEILMAAIQSPTLGKMTDIPTLYKKYLDILNLQDVFLEKPQGPPTTEQAMMMQQKAAEDAKNEVGQMSPQEQEQAVSQLQGT